MRSLASPVLWILVTGVLASTAAGAPAAHRIRIDVRGPLALVEVERALSFGPELGRAPSDELVVDLDLPDGSRLVDAQLRGPDEALELLPTATETYSGTLQTRQWRRAKVAVDEGADLRLTVAASGLGNGEAGTSWSLRYRFVAPMSCRDGALVLAMPGSLDPAPAPAEVSARVSTGQAPIAALAIGPVVRAAGGATSASARAAVPTAAPWEVMVALGRQKRQIEQQRRWRPIGVRAGGGRAPAGRRAGVGGGSLSGCGHARG